MMTDEQFEALVNQAIESIPSRFLKRLDNVAITIADKPTKSQLSLNHVEKGSTLLGLYEGVPLTERGEFYGTGEILPDKITIFKLPIIEDAAGNQTELIKIVRDTVWHEIAHYFGYDDHQIFLREMEGKNFSK